jgi:hypothetical protein
LVNCGGPWNGKAWYVYSMAIITAIWYILWPFGNLAPIWYIFSRFGILCQEKSGNPGHAWDGITTKIRSFLSSALPTKTYHSPFCYVTT